jgi:hypothetical protein
MDTPSFFRKWNEVDTVGAERTTAADPSQREQTPANCAVDLDRLFAVVRTRGVEATR